MFSYIPMHIILIFCTGCFADGGNLDKSQAINWLKDGFADEEAVTYSKSSAYFTDTADRKDMNRKLDRTRIFLFKLQGHEEELMVATIRHRNFPDMLRQWIRDVKQYKQKLDAADDDSYKQLALEWKNQFESWYSTELSSVIADLKRIQTMDYSSAAQFITIHITLFIYCIIVATVQIL